MSLLKKEKKEKIQKAIDSGDTSIVPGIVKKILPIVETKPKISDVQTKPAAKKQQKTTDDEEPVQPVQQPVIEQPVVIVQEKRGSTLKKAAAGAAVYLGAKALGFLKKKLSITRIMDGLFPPSK